MTPRRRPPPGTTNRIDVNEAVPKMGQLREAEFWSRVQHGEPQVCWPWTAASLPKGYGLFSVNGHPGATALAHRIAYIIGNGPIPPGLVVRHSCHNPPCCNPNHLVCGTYAENEADKKRRIICV